MEQVMFEQLALLMYPANVLHRFGVNGKISGSVGAAGEMQDVVAVLHSPKGCGFHYRQSARRRHQPYYALMSSGLKERDVIFGGEEALFEAAREAYFRYRPKLVLLIPSPVSDILNEDLLQVANRLRDMGIPTVAVVSELFSHRDKNYSRKRLKELAGRKLTDKKRMETELKGCGFTELLYALVNQLMEPCVVQPRSINIETVGWGPEGEPVLHEIGAFLQKAGVTVNCWIPSDSVEKLKAAPAARLNVVRRIRWAKRMKERFGTEYLHLGTPGRYTGLEGICNFYRDIGEALSIKEEMDSLTEQEKERTLETVKEELRYLSKRRCLIFTRSLSNAPEQMKHYAVDYGMQVSAIIVQITESLRRDMDLTPELEKKLMDRIEEARRLYAPDCCVFINPREQVFKEQVSQADLLVGSSDFRLEGKGIPVLPEKRELLSLSFPSYIRSVRQVAQLARQRKERKDLLLNRMEFSDNYFPMLAEPDMVHGRDMWTRMWLERKTWQQKERADHEGM